MDFGNLKTSIEKIEMSDEMQARIIKNCRLSTTHKTEEFTMKKRNNNWFMKPIAIAAVLSFLCSVVDIILVPCFMFSFVAFSAAFLTQPPIDKYLINPEEIDE